MSPVQVAVRFSDSKSAYPDRLVEQERARNRAEAVRLAVEISRRADRDAADVAAYVATVEHESSTDSPRYGVAQIDS